MRNFSPLSRAEIRDPANRHTVIARARRLTRRPRVRAPGTEHVYVKPPRLTYAKALEIVTAAVTEDEHRAYVREAMRWLRAGMYVISHDPERFIRDHQEREAAKHLRNLQPRGVSYSVWCEIVAHFRSRCATCGALATAVGRLEDGTPIPACAVHEAMA